MNPNYSMYTKLFYLFIFFFLQMNQDIISEQDYLLLNLSSHVFLLYTQFIIISCNFRLLFQEHFTAINMTTKLSIQLKFQRPIGVNAYSEFDAYKQISQNMHQWAFFWFNNSEIHDLKAIQLPHWASYRGEVSIEFGARLQTCKHEL